MAKCKNMIHMDINVNETETNRNTLDELIEKFPDITSPDMMEICWNWKLDYSNKNNMNEGGKLF